MKKSIRFISVFIALTLIALSLPVSFACPPPFDELDAEIQNRQRMSDRICPSEIKTDKYTFKYSTADGEKTRIECDDGGTLDLNWICRIDNKTGESTAIIKDALFGLAADDNYVYYASWELSDGDIKGVNYIRTDYNGDNKQILYTDSYTPYGSGVGNPPNFLLTAHALYVYKFNLVEISLDTFEKTVLVESVQDHTGEAEWMNLDFVYDDTFYFSVECNGICNTDNCYMLTPIKTGYLCFAPDVEACPDTFRLLLDENDKEAKKAMPAFTNTSLGQKAELTSEGIHIYPYSSNTESFPGCWYKFDDDKFTIDEERQNSKNPDTIQYLLFSDLAYKNLDNVKGKYIKDIADDLYPNDGSADNRFQNITGKIQKATVMKKYLTDWTVKDTLRSSSGFYAAIFHNEKSDNYVLAVRGSQSLFSYEGVKDWTDDIIYSVRNEISSQMEEVPNLVGDYLAQNSDILPRLSVTGHSLGGGLGIMISNMYGLYAETFDASPMLDVSYYRMTFEYTANFSGIDKWIYIDHVGEGDAIGGHEYDYKNAVKHKKQANVITTPSLSPAHSRDSLITIDEKNQEIEMSPITDEHYSKNMDKMEKAVKHRFIVADRCLPKGSLVMGTSNYDSLFGYSGDTTWYMNTIAVPHTDVMYGGDGDDVLLPQTGDDYIIGGKGDDRIYGDTGDDVYFYSQGDGTDTIIDSSGNDEIWLLNYTKEQLKKFKIDTKSDNNYILVYDDVGTLIFNIWKTSGTSTHSMDIKYVTDEKTESYTRLVDWNRVKSVRKLKFACPVDIGIYNGNGDLVTTLYDGEESLFSDDNGVYSVVYDGEEYVKCIDVSDESYRFVISGKDNGTMCIDECFVSGDGKLLTEYTAKSVPVYKASTYKLSLNGDDEPQLDGTEYNVEFDKKQYVPVLSAKIKKDNIRIAVEKGKQLSVSVNPKNADNKNVEWASMDESIATVDENGYVKGVAPGETTVVAEIDGKTAVCTVNVAEKQFNYLILIIPGALILLTAVGVLIVVAVKRKNKKTLVPCENGQHRKSAFCGRLKVVSGNQFGQEYSLDSQNEKSVGKAQDCDIKLDESYKKVSRRHCVIKLSENGLGYEVMDTSSNGTYVQKIKLPRNEFAFIPAGATLLLADAECELLLLPPIRNN